MVTEASSAPALVHNLHDRFFGQVFRHHDVAVAEINRMLSPELLRHLDLGGLALDETALQDAGYRSLFSDRLFRVPLKGSGEVFIWLLIEHQSTNHRLMPLRLLEYASSRWRGYRTLHKTARHIPLLIPIVIQHGAPGWTAPREFSELYNVTDGLLSDIGPYAINFRYLLDDLHGETEEALLARCSSAALRSVLLALKNGGAVKASASPIWGGLFTELGDGDNFDLIDDLVWYLLQGGSTELIQHLEKENVTVQHAAENILDRKFNEGFVEGEAKGEAKGEVEGVRRLLRTMLTAHPGFQVTEEVEARLRTASVAQMEQWTQRLVVGESPAVVLDL